MRPTHTKGRCLDYVLANEHAVSKFSLTCVPAPLCLSDHIGFDVGINRAKPFREGLAPVTPELNSYVTTLRIGPSALADPLT